MHGHTPSTSPVSLTDIDHSVVRAHLADVVGSEAFAGSERRRTLLTYLVEETLEGRGGDLKAYRIGRTALGRPSGFDPQSDPIVRVEIGRLRSTLDRYYRAHPASGVVISIPKGRYAAEFFEVEHAETSAELSPVGGVVHIEPFSSTSDSAADIAEAITESLTAFVVRTTGDPSAVVDEPDDHAEVDTCVVRGSVRVAGDRIRVACEIALPGHCGAVAATTVDDDLSDADNFDVADRVAERIGWLLLDDWGPVARRGLQLTDRESPKRARRAQVPYRKAFVAAQPDDVVHAVESLAPVAGDDARALAALSDATTVSWMLSAELADVRDRAEELACRAVGIDPRLPEAHLALGYAYFTQRNSELMRKEFDVALSLGTPSPGTLYCTAFMLALDGSPEEGIPTVRRAVDLSPDLPQYWRLVPCLAALHRGEADEAYVESLQIGDTMGFAGPALRLAAAHARGKATPEETKQFLDRTPDPAIQPLCDTIGRVFHDDLVSALILDAVAASGTPTG